MRILLLLLLPLVHNTNTAGQPSISPAAGLRQRYEGETKPFPAIALGTWNVEERTTGRSWLLPGGPAMEGDDALTRRGVEDALM
ncbi:hypothetical protein E2C01_100305 [Portunus trituberculatus]|uniref:NUDIX hydrolase n=1 Tax=Portunus trituberculatus TaxID=210409 RepID=A0A5B7KH79_PORTR|nr:hypothetical protein [Portunus trituberculatus]